MLHQHVRHVFLMEIGLGFIELVLNKVGILQNLQQNVVDYYDIGLSESSDF